MSYGYFHSNDADVEKGIYSGAFYITLGREINQTPVFNQRLAKVNPSDKGSFGIYMNTTAGIIRNIVKYGVDADGVLKVMEGIQRAEVIESPILASGLFKEKKLVREEVDKIVNAALGSNVDK